MYIRAPRQQVLSLYFAFLNYLHFSTAGSVILPFFLYFRPVQREDLSRTFLSGWPYSVLFLPQRLS